MKYETNMNVLFPTVRVHVHITGLWRKMHLVPLIMVEEVWRSTALRLSMSSFIVSTVSNRYTVLSKVLKTQISTQEPRAKASKPNRGADSVQIMPRAKRFDGEAQEAEGKAWGEQGKLCRERSP